MAKRPPSGAPQKPSPVVVGTVTAYAVRGPTKRDPRWYWQAKGLAFDGKRPTLWSGRATPEEVTEALALVVVSHGATPDVEKVRKARTAAAGLSVSDLLAQWMSHVEATSDKYSPHTRRNYESISKRLTRELGGYAVDEVTPAFLERYHSLRMGQGASKGTADLALRVLRTAWNWGHRNRLLKDVWPKPSLRLRDRTDRKRPTHEQIQSVLAVLRRDAPEWCWRLAYLLAQTGMRVSEAWGLTVNDVVFNKDRRRNLSAALEIRDVVGVAKTGARTVWVAAAAADEIEGWVKKHSAGARLIGDVTQTTATMGAAHYLRPAVQAIGGDWTGWHSFRRAAADSYAEAGVDPVVAAAQMGHTVQVMQSVYRTVRDEQAQAAAAALAAVQGVGPGLKVVDEG